MFWVYFSHFLLLMLVLFIYFKVEIVFNLKTPWQNISLKSACILSFYSLHSLSSYIYNTNKKKHFSFFMEHGANKRQRLPPPIYAGIASRWGMGRAMGVGGSYERSKDMLRIWFHFICKRACFHFFCVLRRWLFNVYSILLWVHTVFSRN